MKGLISSENSEVPDKPVHSVTFSVHYEIMPNQIY